MSPADAAPRDRAVAIVGASRNRRKFGNKAVRAFRDAGWEVYPVNLAGGTIEGLGVARSLDELPASPDRISIYLHPGDTLAVLSAVARCGAAEVWLNPGSADDRVRGRARQMSLPIVEGCSIVDIGRSPADYP